MLKTFSDYKLRRIKETDNPQITQLIESVMTEFGAIGPGYSIEDSEVKDMFQHYQGHDRAYFVIDFQNQVVAGAGVAPLMGGEPSTCELKKMYMFSQHRGKGLGKLLLKSCIEFAASAAYRECYLETLASMEAANKLYQVVLSAQG